MEEYIFTYLVVSLVLNPLMNGVKSHGVSMDPNVGVNNWILDPDFSSLQSYNPHRLCQDSRPSPPFPTQLDILECWEISSSFFPLQQKDPLVFSSPCANLGVDEFLTSVWG